MDQPRPTHIRHVVLVLLALAPACAYLTRNISAANTTIAAEFSASDTVMGEVLAGFALGYFIFQVPGGLVASAWGVRRTLPVISLAWSLCALWSSFAGSPDDLWLARVGMGVTQAGLVPCCAQALAMWFPASRRGLASAFMTGAMQLGGIAATELTARLLKPIGWRGAMQWYSATGAVWAVAFFLWFRNHPREHRLVNAAERALIEARETGAEKEGPSLAAQSVALPRPRPTMAALLAEWWSLALILLTSTTVWCFAVQAVFRAYAYEFYGTWCPALLEKGYGLSTESAASLTTWPLWTMGIGSLVSGFIVDAVMVRSGSRWLSRSGMALLGLSVCAACFALATQIASPTLFMVVIAVGAFFASLGGPATWATAMDLGGRRAAVLAGGMNMMGNIGAYYCPKQVGILFEYIEKSTGNWNLVLWLFAGVNLAAGLFWIPVNPRRPVLDSPTHLPGDR
ncbi:MAG: MFS transporter [Planctomycetales bacterium]